jgi:hypothetical protein
MTGSGCRAIPMHAFPESENPTFTDARLILLAGVELLIDLRDKKK